jgi:hypothetical protein
MMNLLILFTLYYKYKFFYIIYQTLKPLFLKKSR